MPALLGYFGITNNGVNLAINLLVLFLVIIWLALIYWTCADAQRRIADPVLVACATRRCSLFPFVGTIVYMIVRPPEYLEDVRERELEMPAARRGSRQLSYLACQQLRARGREGLPELPELPQPPARAVRRPASARSSRAGRSAPTASAGRRRRSRRAPAPRGARRRDAARRS